MLLSPALLSGLTTQWSIAGYQVCIHAIGDAANRAALDAISATPPNQLPFPPFRIEHAQIISPEDQIRMKELGVVASIQPTHATSDQFYAEKRLGKKRLAERAYRMKGLLPRVLGSDFPVEPPAVLRGVYAAVTRRDPGTGKSVGDGKGWYPEERLDIGEALRGFTRDVAFAAGMADRAGAVERGRWADWVVLSRRVVLDPAEWRQWEWLRDEEVVKETWIAGRRRFLRKLEAKTQEKKGCSKCGRKEKSK
jgi:predicted amidohydrolase YtcJ